MKWKALMLCVLLALTGCSADFDRSALSERLQNKDLQVTDAHIQRVLEGREQLDFPIKLVVRLVGETYKVGGPEGMDLMIPSAEQMMWTEKDKDEIKEWCTSLEEEGIVSDVLVVTDPVSSEDDLKSARFAAAKEDADVVLYVKWVAQVDNHHNPLSIFDLLIVPAFFVPSEHSDTLLMMKGALVDVRSEFLYASVEAEGVGKNMGPTALIDNKDSIKKAKAEALKNFGDEFIERMKALKERK